MSSQPDLRLIGTETCDSKAEFHPILSVCPKATGIPAASGAAVARRRQRDFLQLLQRHVDGRTCQRRECLQHEDLQEIVSAARKLASTDDIPRHIATELEVAVRAADGLLGSYNTASRVWDEQRRRAIEMTKVGQNGTELFQQATEEYIKSAAPFQERFISEHEQLLKLHGQALGYLRKKLNRLKRASRISENSSWGLYALGTSLAIVGKWLETTQK
jgi:hypothetical protein